MIGAWVKHAIIISSKAYQTLRLLYLTIRNWLYRGQKTSVHFLSSYIWSQVLHNILFTINNIIAVSVIKCILCINTKCILNDLIIPQITSYLIPLSYVATYIYFFMKFLWSPDLHFNMVTYQYYVDTYKLCTYFSIWIVKSHLLVNLFI